MAITVFQILGKIAIDKGNSDQALDDTASKGKTLSSQLSEVSQKTGEFGAKSAVAGAALTAGITVPVVNLGKKIVNLASDYNESLNKVEVAFGTSSDSVVAFSETSLKSFGISKGAALDMASLFGDMGTSMGLSSESAADMSTSLVGLAGDLSSFKNISTDQAMTALNGIFTGETESLKSLGIVMTQTNLDAYALAQGYGKTTSEMTQAEQVQLRYNYVMSQTSNAQGDYARTSDGTANSIRTFQGALEELGTTFGQNVLPVLTPIVQGLTSMAEKFGQMPQAAQQTILVLLAVAASIGPVLVGIGSVAGAISSITGLLAPAAAAAEGAAAAAASAAGATEVASVSLGSLVLPIAGVVAGIAAFIAILVGAWQNSEKFRDSVTGAWTRIQQGAQQCFSKIQTALAPVIQTFQELWAQVQPVLQQIGDMLATYVVPIIESVVAFVLTSITNIISGIAPLLSAVGNILSVIVNVVGMVVALINGDWNGAMEFGKQALQSLWDAVVNVWNGIWGTISALLSVIVNGISAAWNAIVSTAQTMLSNLWNAFSTGFSNLWSSVSGWAATVVTNISSALSGLWQIGSDALQDFSDGMKSGFESLWTNITSWCGTVVDKFKEALGIASPSKVMTELGGFVTEGFFNGLSAADWGGFATGIMDQVVEAFKNGGATLSALVSKLGSGITSILSSMGVDLSGLFGGTGGGNVQSLGGLLWPTTSSSITSWFGYRNDTGGVGSTYHQGLDIGAGYGEPIYAAADGQVEVASWYGGYGNAVKLANGDGIETLYGHMSAIAVGAGDIVSKGQVIGYVGSTGNSTGPHLHFSVLVNGEQVDPSQFFGLAKGGVVRKPIWTKLGEAGESEAVVPLSKASGLGFGITKEDLIDALRIVMNERDNQKQEINLTGKIEMDGQTVGKIVAPVVKEENDFVSIRNSRLEGITV